MSAFAKQTGDIAVLSKTDLAVLALTLTLELEAHGSKRIRLAPGKESEYEREQSRAAFLARDAKRRAKQAAEPSGEVDTVAQQLEALSTGEATVDDAVDDEATDTAAAEDDLDDGEWITPDNVDLHKSRDLGLFPSLDPTATPAPDPSDAPVDDTLVGCMTGDFAMQNVLLQMGMEVVGVGGKRVSQVRTWVLRCHACFKCVLALLSLLTS